MRGRTPRPGDGGVPGHPEDDPGDPVAVARAVCLRLLTTAPRTRAQLADAMARRGVPEDAAAAVLDRFTEVGLIDDRMFAEAWVSSRHRGRGLGRRALSRELRQRGVDSSTVNEAVDSLDPHTEEETARALVRRRLAAASGRRDDPTARARRLVGMLARRGYPPGTAVRVVREEMERGGRGPDDHGLDDVDEPDDVS